MKSIYELTLHESTIIAEHPLFVIAIRVAGGWIYQSIDKGNKIGTNVFVPWHNEFQIVKDQP